MLVLLGLLCATPAHAAPTWLSPLNLSEAGQHAFVPQAALDAEGNALAIWRRHDGQNSRIQFAARPAGGTFGAPRTLSEAGRDAFEPQLSLDRQGNAVAVWQASDGANLQVQAAARPAGGSFGAPQTLSDAGQDAYGVQVALDGEGNALVVWHRFDGTNTRVQAATRPAGGSFGAAQTISEPGGSAGTQQVAIDAQGNALVVWHASDGANLRVQAAARPAGGSFAPPQTLSEAGLSAVSPQLALGERGSAVVVWTRSDGASNRIQVATRPAGGSFASPQTLSEAGQDAYEPQVALDGRGNALVVWQRSDGATSRIQASARPAGGPFGAAETLSEPGREADQAELVIDSQGNALVAWRGDDGQNRRVQAAARPAGGAFASPETVSSPGRGAFEPQLAVDREGNALAVWQGSGGGADRIEAAGYDAAGPQLRGLAMPAFGSQGAPLSFSVSPFDVWSTVPSTVWSFGDARQAAGRSVGHAYSAPGSFLASVTATDSVGNSTSASKRTGVFRRSDTSAPVLSGVSVSNRRFRVGRSATPTAAEAARRRVPAGTRFLYSISERSTVTITLEQVAPGRRTRRGGGACRRASERLRRHRRCTRYIHAGRIVRQGQGPGRASTPFSGRIARKALRPGRYRASLRASDAAGNRSAVQRAGFRVVRR